MGKIEILEDYNKPFVFQGKDYLLNYDPDAYAVEAVEKYWSDKILPLSVEIQEPRMIGEMILPKKKLKNLQKINCLKSLK